MSEQRSFQNIEDKPRRVSNTSGALYYPQRQTILALVVIWLGIVFILQQMNLVTLDFNWWAIFILIPGAWLLLSACAAYLKTDGWTQRTRIPLIGGVMLLLVGNIFIFNLDWGKVWPLFLIVPAMLMLLGFMRGNNSE